MFDEWCYSFQQVIKTPSTHSEIRESGPPRLNSAFAECTDSLFFFFCIAR
uniref:Uncharacterized protein n=1 Tax=Anguilla anguilla TaxID=7936 RepID=A0A0E9XZ12_ANGAN